MQDLIQILLRKARVSMRIRNAARLMALAAVVIGVLAAPAIAQTVYFHNDVAGSPIAATDAAGDVLWRESYRPYGERMLKPAAANAQWFHGKQLDPDTGFEDFGARNYDPILGRFLSIDPVDFQDKNIHTFNRYTYGNNNPLKYKDPDGRQGIPGLRLLAITLEELYASVNARIASNTVAMAAINTGTGVAAAEVGAPYIGGGAGITSLLGWYKVVKGHHVPAKSVMRGAEGYDPEWALAIPLETMRKMGWNHNAISGAQKTLYSAFEKTGQELTWDAVEHMEIKAMIVGGVPLNYAQKFAKEMVGVLKEQGMKPMRFPNSAAYTPMSNLPQSPIPTE